MQTDTMFSSETGIHYTPADIAERARAVLRRIELDPASDATANVIIKADRYYADPHTHDVTTLNDRHFDPIDRASITHISQITGTGRVGFDGLRSSWRARTVWLNPPFTMEKRDANGALVLSDRTDKPIRERVIGQWVTRWRKAITDQEVTEAAMLLVPARTDTEWFRPLFGLPMCFVNGRLRFSEAKAGAPFPTVIAYYGKRLEWFYMLFEDIGECGTFIR